MKTLKVMCVSHHKYATVGLVEKLNEKNYDVDTFPDIDEAVDTLHQIHYDYIIINQYFFRNNITGLDIAMKAREITNTPILIYTVDDSDELYDTVESAHIPHLSIVYDMKTLTHFLGMNLKVAV